MRWIVCYDGFEPRFETKCSGQIVKGLLEAGEDALLVTKEKEQLLNYDSPFEIIQINEMDKLYELVYPSDRVIFYSWLAPVYTGIIRELAKINEHIIIKADSDGRIGVAGEPYRRFSNYINLKSAPRWKALPRIMKSQIKIIAKIKEKAILDQIDRAERVAIESPDAAQNLSVFLARNAREDLIGKVSFIPNPVSPEVFSVESPEKENILISIGRWEDEIQKNTKTMVATISHFLEKNEKWRAFVVGTGCDSVRHFIKKEKPDILDRLNIIGSIDHSNIKSYLGKAKILFMPSRFESFGIVAAEAVCSGCSIVGSPIESLRYLTMQGFSGSTSSSFTDSSFFSALIYEANEWERGVRDPSLISQFWRKRLNPLAVAEEFIRVASFVKG